MTKRNFQENISEFHLVANEYCRLLENIASFSKRKFISDAQKILNLLYLKASLIEKPEYQEDDVETEKFVTENDWLFIKDMVISKLASSDKYIDLVLPGDIDPENYEAVPLSECFVDIYQDLKDFSSNVELGNDDAIRISFIECMENFEKFWGIRALTILIAIHNLLYGEELNEEEDLNSTEENDSGTDMIDTSNWLINKRFNN
jgi:hypothetical protein